MFSIVTVSIYTPTNNAQGLPFSTSSSILVNFGHFESSHPRGCVLIFQCSLICISMIVMLNTFSCACLPYTCLFQKHVYLDPLPILNMHVFGGLVNYRILHTFQKLTLFRYVVCKYFLPFHGLSDNKSTDNKSKNEQVRLQSYKLLKLKHNLFVESNCTQIKKQNIFSTPDSFPVLTLSQYLPSTPQINTRVSFSTIYQFYRV